MISCTEFIPLYSEFFKYLERRGGHDAVMEYWIHISDTVIEVYSRMTDAATAHSLEDIIAADRAARRIAEEIIAKH